MTAKDSLKRGDLQAFLEDLQRLLRKNPGDLEHRISLFEAFSVMGAWEKARVQLSILDEMALHREASDIKVMVQTYGQLLCCEAIRQAVFKAVRTPNVLGDPEPWLAQMVQALRSTCEGDTEAGMNHCRNGLAAAPATAGTIDGQHFAWIGDSDRRLGPVIEAIIDGRYFWVPFDRVAKMTLESPVDLRDLVWLPAAFTWANGGQSIGFVPTRYPGSELSADSDIQLGRKTVWQDDDLLTTALGQRVLATDQDDYALMDVRTLEFAHESRPEPVETARG
ncbi:MAG: type VI secretion system accessory protein TagJ [Geminicoccaceae bacterium]